MERIKANESRSGQRRARFNEEREVGLFACRRHAPTILWSRQHVVERKRGRRDEGEREGGEGKKKTSLGRKTTYYAAQRVYTSVRRRVGGPECPDAKQNLTN